MYKSGFITIIGRPNVGKSTLLNSLIGEKLSIVSNKPQTTRNNISLILTNKQYQFVFVDTPGIHKPKHVLGEYMVKVAKDSIKEVDLILFVTTPEQELHRGDIHILEKLKNINKPVFLVINKIDEKIPETIVKTIKTYSEFFSFKEVIPISAIKGKNKEELINTMLKYIPEGPQYYPSDMITDKNERFIVSEIIREKALRVLSQEVPHGIAIEVLKMKKDKNDVYEIEVNMFCEKESHKGIIVGKNGSTLKRISTYARMDIEKFLDNKVYLKIWVKSKKEWRNNNFILNELGYK